MSHKVWFHAISSWNCNTNPTDTAASSTSGSHCLSLAVDFTCKKFRSHICSHLPFDPSKVIVSSSSPFIPLIFSPPSDLQWVQIFSWFCCSEFRGRAMEEKGTRIKRQIRLKRDALKLFVVSSVLSMRCRWAGKKGKRVHSPPSIHPFLFFFEFRHSFQKVLHQSSIQAPTFHILSPLFRLVALHVCPSAITDVSLSFMPHKFPASMCPMHFAFGKRNTNLSAYSSPRNKVHTGCTAADVYSLDWECSFWFHDPGHAFPAAFPSQFISSPISRWHTVPYTHGKRVQPVKWGSVDAHQWVVVEVLDCPSETNFPVMDPWTGERLFLMRMDQLNMQCTFEILMEITRRQDEKTAEVFEC